MKRSRQSLCAGVLACSVLGLLGCEEPVQVGGNAPPRAPRRPAAGAPAAPGPAAADVDAGVADAGTDGAIVYRDEDFVEQDVLNRDPFRDFVITLQAQAPVVNPRQVKLRTISIDQMQLIAIITGIPVPYAMIQDLEGVGHVIVRGDYIGREDVVNAGGADGMPIALNWRVDRIRNGEIILTREDPLHPDQPPLMRSMSLREVAQDQSAAQAAQQGQLTNTGDLSAAPQGSVPGVVPPAPTPPRRSTPTSGEPTAPPAPPSVTAPTESGGTTSTGSGSRFGGVFNRR